MDKNSITGIIVICAIMFAWMWWAAPGKEELVKQKRTRDSLELVEKQRAKDTVGSWQLAVGNDTTKHPIASKNQVANNDSARKASLNNKYDVFASAGNGKDEYFTIENELLKAKTVMSIVKIVRVIV